MAAVTLESLFEKEFQEAEKTLESLRARREDIEQQIAAAEQRFTNLRNAQAALQGKLIIPTAAPKERRKPRAVSTRAPRGAGGELQKRILAVFDQHPNGASAELINQELDATDDAAKKPIAAALFRMKKSGVLLQAARRGAYTLAPPEAFEPPA